MPLKLITPPSAYPLDVGLVAQHAKLDVTDDYNLLLIFMDGATEMAQIKTQRQIVAARYQYILDGFPGPSLLGVPMGTALSLPVHAIILPRSPLIELISIEYLGMDGNTYTMDPATYTCDMSCDPPRITPLFGQIWPINMPQIGSVKVNFLAGYAAPISVNTTNNTIAPALWNALTIGNTVRFSNSGGVLPTPLMAKTDYYIQSVPTPGNYTLSASNGGAAITLTSAGTGSNYMGQTGINGSTGEIPGSFLTWILTRINTQESFRASVVSTRGVITELPYIDRLLDPVAVVLA